MKSKILNKTAQIIPGLFGPPAGNGRLLQERNRLPNHEGKSKVRESTIYFQPAETLYRKWPAPTCIIVDGPYGVAGFPGDLPAHGNLAEWYKPHIEQWSKYSTPRTTLWFWCTEIGWATVHPIFVRNEWEYRACHVWDKGMSHVAGNSNTQTLRKLPVVTEVCVQYIKPPRFEIAGCSLSMQDWLRYEWKRTGLPFHLANEACEVANAATRKYLTADHLWYYPPPEAFEKLARFANEHGRPEGKPYFSTDRLAPISATDWSKLRAKFKCEAGVTNVWREPQVSGIERIQGQRNGMRYKFASLHGSQKPRRLIELLIRTCTDESDVVWEPFGGLCPGAVVCCDLNRKYYAAEILPEFYAAAVERLNNHAKATRPSGEKRTR
ncbi:MAG TPA: DNA methyltransferase [Terriglobia bacterium]|nr:DNA methyltransferase [Terriglobia bacterium]